MPQTPCGAGSTLARTKVQREWIPRIVEQYEIHSIVDIGAGDLNWINEIDWPYPLLYRAYDLVPRVSGVERLDIINETPPPADLLMCLWVLNHLPEREQKAATARIAASGSKYIMYTYWPAMPAHLDWGADESVVINDKKQAELRLINAHSLDDLLG